MNPKENAYVVSLVISSQQLNEICCTNIFLVLNINIIGYIKWFPLEVKIFKDIIELIFLQTEDFEIVDNRFPSTFSSLRIVILAVFGRELSRLKNAVPLGHISSRADVNDWLNEQI